MRRVVFILSMCAAGLAAPAVGAGPATGPATRAHQRQALRWGPLVDLFEAARVSVVSIAARKTVTVPATRPAPAARPAGAAASTRPATRPADQRITRVQWATGFVLHKAGYILTNGHALRLDGKRMATFWNGKSYPLRVIAVDEAHDLALLKVDAPRPLKPLRLGASADLRVGERMMTIGNPFGMGLTLGRGCVTALGRSTQTDYALLTDMIQVDAPINPGNSGGPLVNMLGEAVGIVTSRKDEAQGIAFATPMDKVRRLLPEMLSAEGRWAFVLGLTVPGGGPAKVADVAKGSPAALAGVRKGDVVAGVDSWTIRRGMDFHLALVGRKAGQKLRLKLRREDKTLQKTITLGRVEPLAAAGVKGLQPGLRYEVYGGKWGRLPDFDKLKPLARGTAGKVALGRYDDRDHFAMRFTGYVEIPREGVWAFTTWSDDGSRLRVGDKLVVDNDGAHPAMARRGFVSLRAGKHAIRVTYYDGIGDDELRVYYQGPGVSRREIPAAALFHTSRPATAPKAP